MGQMMPSFPMGSHQFQMSMDINSFVNMKLYDKITGVSKVIWNGASSDAVSNVRFFTFWQALGGNCSPQFPSSHPQQPVLSHRLLLTHGQSSSIFVYQLRMTIRKARDGLFSLHTYSLGLKKGEKEIRGCFSFKCWYRLDLRLWFVRYIYKTN